MNLYIRYKMNLFIFYNEFMKILCLFQKKYNNYQIFSLILAYIYNIGF